MRRSIFAVTACAALVFSAQNSYAGFLGGLEDAATGSNGAAIGGLAGGKKGALIGAGAGFVTEQVRHHYQNKNNAQKQSESNLRAVISRLTQQKANVDAAVDSAQKDLSAAEAQKANLTDATAKAHQDEVIAKAKAKLSHLVKTQTKTANELTKKQSLLEASNKNAGQ